MSIKISELVEEVGLARIISSFLIIIVGFALAIVSHRLITIEGTVFYDASIFYFAVTMLLLLSGFSALIESTESMLEEHSSLIILNDHDLDYVIIWGVTIVSLLLVPTIWNENELFEQNIDHFMVSLISSNDTDENLKLTHQPSSPTESKQASNSTPVQAAEWETVEIVETVETGTLSYNSETGVITDMALGGKSYLGWGEVLMWNPKYDVPERSRYITSGYHIATQAEARVFLDAAGVGAIIKREVLNEEQRPEIEVINYITKLNVFGDWDNSRHNMALFKSDIAGRYGFIKVEDFDDKKKGQTLLHIMFDEYGMEKRTVEYLGNNLKFDPDTPPFATWLLVAD